MTWTAYVDESMRAGAGVYLLAAACLDNTELVEARAAVAQLGRPTRRFHWRNEEPDDRAKAVGVVASLPALHLVVVAARLDPRRQERARRHCLRRLLFELDAAGVTHAWLESRGRRHDLRDLQAVNVLRIQRAVGTALVVDHARPLDEPLLWVPDIVAGAIGGELDLKERYADQLATLVTRYDIELH